MRIGLIGSGNMAAALARGAGPARCTARGTYRAPAVAEELAGARDVVVVSA